jgi:hypothetical protein
MKHTVEGEKRERMTGGEYKNADLVTRNSKKNAFFYS